MKKKMDSNQLKSVRYSEDNPINANLFSSDSNTFAQIKNSFLMNHLPVNKKSYTKYISIYRGLFVDSRVR